MTAIGQGFLEGVVVLDDPVVDQGKLAVSAEVGVGVGVVGCAVGGPTGMPDAQRAGRGVVADVGEQVVDLAFAAVVFHTAAVSNHGNARTVIPAVFEPLQPFDEQGKGLLFSEVTDDAAHVGKIGEPGAGESVRPGDDERRFRGGDRGVEDHLL